MAIQVSFKGFVNEVKKYDWGTVYDVSHAQRQKDEQDEWTTVGYDYFDVVYAAQAPEAEKGDMVEVQGKLKTKRYQGKDGVQRQALQVRADVFVIAQKSKRGPAAVQQVFGDIKPEVEGSAWPEPKQAPIADTEIPF